MSESGMHKNWANSLIIFTGMSPGGVDFLDFSRRIYSLIRCGENWGISWGENGGILISLFSISL